MKSFSKKTPQIVDTDPILRIRLAFSIIGIHLPTKVTPPLHIPIPQDLPLPLHSVFMSALFCVLLSAPLFSVSGISTADE